MKNKHAFSTISLVANATVALLAGIPIGLSANEAPSFLGLHAASDASSYTSRVQPAGISDDPRAVDQWQLDAPPDEIAGTGLRAALATPRQLESVIVAVVDTGILSTHSDSAELLPGYDFVSDIVPANDGDGRDNDPTDPGDWVSQEDIDSGLLDEQCTVANSTWHGTAVAGVLAAKTDNSIGVSGAAPMVKILPVRVMGRCGGSVPDLIAGIRWAAGLPVAGAPTNENPAAIINLSLGYFGSCDKTMQRAIDDAREAGAVIVTAIGNGGHKLSEHPYSPASCQGVVTVAASNREGNLADYNNRGEAVDILAPGGVPGAGLLTLDDGGTRSARNDDMIMPRYGSSIATPLVSAAAALIVAANPLLEPHHVKTLIETNSREVSDAEQCEENSCGAGLLDARLAVHAAATTDVTTLPDDEFQGGGGALNPLWFLLILLQRSIGKFAQFMQYRRGKLSRP